MNTGTGELMSASAFKEMADSLLTEDEKAEVRRKWKEVGYATPEQVKRGKVGRNESCPCGSGAKFKKCCLTPK